MAYQWISLQSTQTLAVPAHAFFALMARSGGAIPVCAVGLPEQWCVIYAPPGQRDIVTGFAIHALDGEPAYHVVGDVAEQWLQTGSQALAGLVASIGPWRPTLLVRLLMVFGFRPRR